MNIADIDNARTGHAERPPLRLKDLKQGEVFRYSGCTAPLVVVFDGEVKATSLLRSLSEADPVRARISPLLGEKEVVRLRLTWEDEG